MPEFWARDEKDGAGVMKGLDGSESTGLSHLDNPGTFPAGQGKRRSTISASIFAVIFGRR